MLGRDRSSLACPLGYLSQQARASLVDGVKANNTHSTQNIHLASETRPSRHPLFCSEVSLFLLQPAQRINNLTKLLCGLVICGNNIETLQVRQSVVQAHDLLPPHLLFLSGKNL